VAETLEHRLSRRERQIMDALFQLGEGTVAEVREAIPDPPSYSAVRTQLRILEDKGFLGHRQDGPRYVYAPTIAKENASQSALRHLRDTFFNGSAEQVMAALLTDTDTSISEAELDRLASLIEAARDAD